MSVFCVFILYMFHLDNISTQILSKVGVGGRIGKKKKKDAWTYRGLSIEEGGSKLLHTMN